VKNTLKFIGLLFTTLILGSCGKETQSTTQGGGKLYIKLTSSPANNTEAIFVPAVFGEFGMNKIYYPKTINSGIITTDSFNVVKGQNFPITISGGNTTSCSNILVEVFLDGKLYRTRNFSVGGIPTGLNGGPSNICLYAASQPYSAGIPYNITID
jgi:hypothetical protein